MSHLSFSKLRVALAGLGLCIATQAGAGPLPSALTVQASITMDSANSLDATGTGTQSVTLSSIVGGVTSSSSFTDTVSAIARSGSLTQTGDGLSASFSMSGSGDGATDGLFADFLFTLSNSSATQTLTVLFGATFSNSVSASGPDAFAFSDISVRDALNNELLFSDHRADSANQANNLTADSSLTTFTITLAPNSSTSVSALQRQRGGAFGGDSVYSALLSASLLIQDVRVSGDPPPPPNDVPVPGTLALSLAGLAGLAWRARGRRNAASTC